MTRISIGVFARELPDQMLVNEAEHELPRLFNMSPCKKVPPAPTLGTGHVSYYRAHMFTVCLWRAELRIEIGRRGLAEDYAVEHPDWCYFAPGGFSHLRLCRELMRADMVTRIRQRVAEMKREPTWSGGRAPPGWLADILMRRAAEGVGS